MLVQNIQAVRAQQGLFTCYIVAELGIFDKNFRTNGLSIKIILFLYLHPSLTLCEVLLIVFQ